MGNSGAKVRKMSLARLFPFAEEKFWRKSSYNKENVGNKEEITLSPLPLQTLTQPPKANK
jgi:hypothetical protein